MLRSFTSPKSPSALLLESAAGNVFRSRPARPMVACCSGQRNRTSIPNLEPFSRSRIDRRLRDPPFLQKFENDLTGRLRVIDAKKEVNNVASHGNLPMAYKKFNPHSIG